MGEFDKFGNRILQEPGAEPGHVYSVDLGRPKEPKLRFDPANVSIYLYTFSDMVLRGRRLLDKADIERFITEMKAKYDGVDEEALRAEVKRMAEAHGNELSQAA
ncbi:MAG: hypothetical protein Q7K39_00550 [Candidatus Magasanikbacteria bacterium]|nr:hypothetical protein [Candidatus Magasanikbacteria bacterium]